MNIDLETCFIGFLIGVAIYLLLNRVFIEGLDQSPSPPPIDCDNQPENLCPSTAKQTGCLDTHNRAWSCNVELVDCKGTNQIWCDNYPGQSPSQSQSQSPGSSPSPFPITQLDVNDTRTFRNYLNFSGKYIHIKWHKMKKENKENNYLYSRIRCALARKEDVTFSEQEIEILNHPIIHNLILNDYILEDDDEYIDISLSFIFELLKFANTDSLKTLDKDARRAAWTVLWGDISVLGGMSTNFPSLKKLDLSESSIYGDISVLGAMSANFPSLKSLDLSFSSISGDISVIGDTSTNFLALEELDLSHTGIYGDISVLGDMSANFSSLKELDLSFSSISGDISVLGGRSTKFPTLEVLDLSHTGIYGDISVLGGMGKKFPSLKELYLSFSSISGDISGLGGKSTIFPTLEVLDLSASRIYGDISVLGGMGANFPSLKELYLSFSSIYGDISVLGDMGTNFPLLQYLYLDATGIYGDISGGVVVGHEDDDIFVHFSSGFDVRLSDITKLDICSIPSSTPSPSSTPPPPPPPGECKCASTNSAGDCIDSTTKKDGFVYRRKELCTGRNYDDCEKKINFVGEGTCIWDYTLNKNTPRK